MNFKSIFFFLILGIAQQTIAMDGKQVTLLLPVNHIVPAEYWVTLAVTVPETFKSVNAPDAPIAEFIPATDSDPYKWSQQITTQFLKGRKISARDFIQSIKTGFCNRFHGRVLDASSQEDSRYSLRKIALVYEFRNRKELVYMQYVSGPADCAGVQYALPLSATRDEAQALAQAEEFMKKNVNLMVGNGEPSSAVD